MSQRTLRLRSGSNPNTPSSSRMEFVTNTEIRTMLDNLKDDIIRSFTGLFESLDKKLDSLERRIDNLENKLAPLQAEQEKQATELACMKGEIEQIKHYTTHELMSEFQERQRRNKNVVLTGVIEAAGGHPPERQAHDMHEVEKIFETMGLPNAAIKDTTRIGRSLSGRARLLRVALYDEELKVRILKNARLLRSNAKYKQVFVNPDRTPSEQAHFSDMWKKLKEMKSRGRDVVIYRGKIVERDSIRQQQNFRP